MTTIVDVAWSRRVARRHVGWALALLFAMQTRASADESPVRLAVEIDVDSPPLTGAIGEQTAARLAFDGQNLIVTWRSALWRNELRAARLDANGTVLDRRGFSLGLTDRGDGHAAVTALPASVTMTSPKGSGFFTAWVDDGNRVLGLRVPSQGPLSASPPVVIDVGDPARSAAQPTLATTSDGITVGFSRAGEHAGIFVARIAATADRVVSPASRVTDGPGTLALLARGDEILVVSAVARAGAPMPTVDVRSARIDSTGKLLDPEARLLFSLSGSEPGPTALALRPNGQVGLVASALAGVAFAETRFAELAADGTIAAGTASVALPVGTAPALGGPVLLGDADGFLALWGTGAAPAMTDPPRVVAARIRSGAVGAVETMLPESRMPAVGRFGDSTWLAWDAVAWRNTMGGIADSDIKAARLGPLGPGTPTATMPSLISEGPAAQGEPSIARGLRKLLVVYEDRRVDRAGNDVYAKLLGGDGSVDPTPSIPLGVGPGSQSAPVVTFDGLHFVVAWYEGKRGLAVARVTEDGQLLDQPPVTIAGTTDLTLLSEPAICNDGDGSLLVYALRRTPPSGPPQTSELRARRIARGAVPSQAQEELLTLTSDVDVAPSLRLTCNATAGLLTFTGSMMPGEAPRLMLGRIARGAQALGRTPGIVRLPSRIVAEWPGIGTDGEGFLVAWRAPDRMGQRAIFGMRMDRDGYLLDQTPWRLANANAGRRVSTTWDGQQYVVLAVNTDGGAPFQLIGHRLGRSGLLFERDWWKVSTLSVPWASGGLGADAVAIADGRLLAVYEQFDDQDASGNPRVRSRVIETPLGSPPDAAPADASARDAGAAANAKGDAGDAETGGDGPSDLDLGDSAAGDARDVADSGRNAASDGGGCGCRVGERPRSTSTPVLAAAGLVALAALARARKRRRARPHR